MHDFIKYGFIWYRVRVGLTHRIGGLWIRRGSSRSSRSSGIEVIEVVDVVEVAEVVTVVEVVVHGMSGLQTFAFRASGSSGFWASVTR